MIENINQKVAAVLFVKDEAFDLPSWIAWYVSYGFDALIIYEDDSSDLTGDVIAAASLFFDVRKCDVPYRLHFQHRQGAVYLDAAEKLRDEFEWVVFVDADEYIYLPNHKNIHDFLNTFPESVGSIAFNWCCYGNGGHVIRPGINVPEQFREHSEPDFFENNTVKSFVRVKQMHLSYQDPHRFDVDGDIVNPLGEQIEWHEEARHRIAGIPDWSNGAILHYAIRSAEHYIEKVKRRSDIRNNVDIGFFTWWNHNEVNAPLPREKLDQLNKILYIIQHKISLDRLLEIRQRPVIYKEQNIQYKPYFLQTFWGSDVCLDDVYGNLLHCYTQDKDKQPLRDVILFLPDDLNYPAYLVSIKKDSFIYLFGENHVSSCIAFKATLHDQKVTLRSYTRRRLITSQNITVKEHLLSMELLADWEKDWEMLTLIPPPEHILSNDIVNYWNNAIQDIACIENVKVSRGENNLWADLFAARLASLSGRERNIFFAKNDIKGLPWLSEVDSISF